MYQILQDYWIYWAIAAIISIFQGYRGYVFQMQFSDLQKTQLLDEKKQIEFNIESNDVLNRNGNGNKNAGRKNRLKSKWLNIRNRKFVIYAKNQSQIVCLRAIPYGFFYFTTTLLGFGALFFVYYVLSNTCINDISGGTAALVIFAVLYGIIGITGQLPSLIEQGKLPK